MSYISRSISIVLCFSLSIIAKAQTYKDINLSAQQRAESIVGEMTLDEKVSLMRYESPAIPRLGIKQYNWWNEALHGVGRAGLATVFPQPIGMAASFDDRLLFDVFTAVSDEARAKNQRAKQEGNLKIYQGLTFWTPNVNIFRDPRWGRGHETYGEDPYLTSRMGISVVRGLQGDNYEGSLYTNPLSAPYYKLYACAKHFAVHSGPEWNRHTFNAADISARDLYETYLPAFESLVRKAGVKEVMCAYNRFEGEPCCGNNRLLNTILRQEWNYQGIVVSDCWAVSDFYNEDAHHVEPDMQHAAAKAVRTGTDLECGATYQSLTDAVSDGLISEDEIDRSVVRLMKARYELGEMDADSLVNWTSIPYSTVNSIDHQALALKMARESIVLLKNDGTLPLDKSTKIGLIGPNANDSIMQWGNYNGFPASTSTLLSALQSRLSKENIVYVAGVDHTSSTMIESLFANTISSTGQPGYDAKFWNDREDVHKRPAISYHYTTPIHLTTAGATVWAPGVNLGGFYCELTTKFKAKQSEDISFSLQTQGWMSIEIDGKEVFRGGNMKSANAYTMKVEKDQTYDIKVNYMATEGDCASLNFDFGSQRNLDTQAIVDALSDVDVILFAGGLSPQLEGEEMPVKVYGFHGGDRDIIELPAAQSRIINILKSTGKPIVYVNYSGSAVALTEADVPAQAILQAWYPGQAGGEAVADVLFGDYNPSGKLPITFYQSTADLPDFEDYSMAHRTYRYFDGHPLYPFGYGLSYTTFEYGEATIEKGDEGAIMSISVRNTGQRQGDEVVQLYISRPDDTEGPTMQLRDFAKVSLLPGESTTVRFRLTADHFAWFDQANNVVRPLNGCYILHYGSSSDVKDLKHLTFNF